MASTRPLRLLADLSGTAGLAARARDRVALSGAVAGQGERVVGLGGAKGGGTGRLVLAMIEANSPDLASQLKQVSSHPDILITVFLLTLWCFPQEVVKPLLGIQDAPQENDKSWITLLYYIHQYMKVKDNQQQLADFTRTLPEDVKEALLRT